MIKEFASYADDNAPFLVGDHLSDLYQNCKVRQKHSSNKTL